MKTRFWICLLLIFALVLPLASCGGGGKDTTKTPSAKPTTTKPGGDSPATGTDWSGVDFNGQTLRIDVSANQDSEVTFGPADCYIKGPDEMTGGVDEVQRKVYNRNHNVKNLLGLNVQYTVTDLAYDGVLNDIEKKFLNSASAPDIYNNDLYGLLRASLLGCFYNVVNPIDENGKVLQNYIDLSADCWYTDYMKGTTLSEEKIYLLAGDYYLDFIRMAWVIYVNIPHFNEALAAAQWDVETLYDYVLNREWTYEEMESIIELAFRDTGFQPGVADREDAVIGFVTNGETVTPRIFTWTNGLSIVEWENGQPSIIENNTNMYTFAQAYKKLLSTPGLLIAPNVLSAVTYFLQGNVLFTMAVMGELESEEMRKADFTKGLVPYPIFDPDYQDDYHSLVHDQAEIGAIMATTRNYTMASAYMQCINEKSADVLQEYYEQTLKIKYSDNRRTREMIDLVHDTIDDAFENLLVNYMLGKNAEILPIFQLVHYRADTFTSAYASQYDAMRTLLADLQKTFDELE